MARPLRIQFAGAVNHVMARSDHGQKIYLDDADRELWLATLPQTQHWVLSLNALNSLGTLSFPDAVHSRRLSRRRSPQLPALISCRALIPSLAALHPHRSTARPP